MCHWNWGNMWSRCVWWMNTEQSGQATLCHQTYRKLRIPTFSLLLPPNQTKPSRSGLSICGLEGGTQSESGGTHRHLLGCVLNSHMAPTMQPRTGPDKSTAGQTRLLRGSLHSYPQRQTFVWYIMLVHILAIYSQRWSPTGERKSHPRLKRIPIWEV